MLDPTTTLIISALISAAISLICTPLGIIWYIWRLYEKHEREEEERERKREKSEVKRLRQDVDRLLGQEAVSNP